MKTLLFEKFENKENFIRLKKKYNLINIGSEKNYNKKNVIAIYVRFIKNLSNGYLNKFQNLKVIISPTTGLNHIDTEYCKKKKIQIINLSKNNPNLKKITSTSEMSLSMILAGVKKISHFYNNSFKLADRYKYQIHQFKNYKVGIIGYGRIGKKLFKDLKFLKFNVFFYDNDKKLKKEKGYLNLKRLLDVSDIISLNLSYTKKNFNFFDKDKFKRCKKNLIFVNTARGELVNELDLLSFLKQNKLSCAFLDVIKNETENYQKNILYKYSQKKNNLFITPHLGGSSIDALKITENIVIKEFINIYRI
tara:strand:- start:23744 stop:24661 length:918 start_codon:yes stop_codon:yes gene_type:complete